MKNKVNILGTQYSIVEKFREEDKKLEENNGYVELYSKEIVVAKHTEQDLKDIVFIKEHRKHTEKVIRHEIMHAFFYESGTRHYSDDEELVDLLAIQLPKIAKEMKKLDILD